MPESVMNSNTFLIDAKPHSSVRFAEALAQGGFRCGRDLHLDVVAKGIEFRDSWDALTTPAAVKNFSLAAQYHQSEFAARHLAQWAPRAQTDINRILSEANPSNDSWPTESS